MSRVTTTVQQIGDKALTTAIIEGSITEIEDTLTTALKDSAFHSCAALVSVKMLSVRKAGSGAFRNCSSLKTVELPELVDGGDFQNCTSLETICLPKLTYVTSFWGCKALKKADFPAATTLGEFCFYQCPLTTLILRSPTVCAIPYGSGTIPGSASVYVPAALLDEYKAATNWSAIASRIFAIEDYPEITGGAT